MPSLTLGGSNNNILDATSVKFPSILSSPKASCNINTEVNVEYHAVER